MAEESIKPPHRGLKKGLYVIPTLFTAANVAMGYLAVLSSIRGFDVAKTNPDLAASSGFVAETLNPRIDERMAR